MKEEMEVETKRVPAKQEVQTHGPPPLAYSGSQVLSAAFLRVWLALRVEGPLWRGGF